MLLSTLLMPMLAVSVLAQDIYRTEKLPIPVSSVELVITEPTSDLGPITLPTLAPVPPRHEHSPDRYRPKPGRNEMK